MKIPMNKVTRNEIDHRKAGEIVRKSRESAKLSLRELARRLLLSAPYMSDLELGRRNWSPELFDLSLKEINRKP